MTVAIRVDPRLDEAASAVRAIFGRAPAVGLVLGSGLGAFSDTLRDRVQIPYSSIPHMPAPTVSGHAGHLTFGTVSGRGDGVLVACLSGRVHAYEGHDVGDVVFGARLLALLGCRAALLTNAAGGIRAGFTPGALMLVSDHLNLTGKNPLAGKGHAFIDMTCAYDLDIRAAAHTAAAEAGEPLHEGVYAGLLGPSYETPAEIRMLRTLGADAVGMSTVLEVIALRHLGVRVGAVSCITNVAAGLSGKTLNHGEVEDVARKSRKAFETLVSRWIVACSDLLEPEE
jgi:purine-nucleoside phosphorylase